MSSPGEHQYFLNSWLKKSRYFVNFNQYYYTKSRYEGLHHFCELHLADFCSSFEWICYKTNTPKIFEL
jgi:hypothetical protein